MYPVYPINMFVSSGFPSPSHMAPSSYIPVPQPALFEVRIGASIKYYPGVGQILNGYHLLKVLGFGAYGAAYSVPGCYGQNDVMKINIKEYECDQSFEREQLVLERVMGHSGFPVISNYFTIGNLQCLVMSNAGMCVEKVFRKNPLTGSCTIRNVLRLGFQIFNLIQKFHDFGFYHRDVHSDNVMLQLDCYGILKVNLIDFGQAKEIERVNEPDNCVLKTWFSSLNVFKGGKFQKIDDFISIVYLLAELVGEDPIGSDVTLYGQQKEQLHSNPYAYFKKENRWLADLYSLMESQRASRLNLESILNVLRNVIPGFDISSDLKYIRRGGNVYCN